MAQVQRFSRREWLASNPTLFAVSGTLLKPSSGARQTGHGKCGRGGRMYRPAISPLTSARFFVCLTYVSKLSRRLVWGDHRCPPL
jgi:hypothetical protein